MYGAAAAQAATLDGAQGRHGALRGWPLLQGVPDADVSGKEEQSTHIDAISFTPMHFFTNWTNIFSFPPSPVSSGKETGGASASSSAGATLVSFLESAIAVRDKERVEGAETRQEDQKRLGTV